MNNVAPLLIAVGKSRTSGQLRSRKVFGAKMADQRTIDIFHEALNFGLKLLCAGDLQLKEKQYEVLKSVVIDNKDVLAVLPTGYG